MNTTTFSSEPVLDGELLDRVLARFGFSNRPAPTFENLRAIYAAWCRLIPFDNVRKIIHVQSGQSAPLPGSEAGGFFEAWLRHGTGGTCWANAGATHALLFTLGFDAVRGIGTMLAAPNIPPNHGTVRVSFGEEQYLVDGSILCGEPLRLDPRAETSVDHPAWGVRAVWREGRQFIPWRPLHQTEGFECRLESFGFTAADFRDRYEGTRGWSPFNYEITARRNRGELVTGVSFGHAVTLRTDGGVERHPVAREERDRILLEQIGLSEEIVAQLPADVPTPPPPGSATARAAAAAT